MSSDNTQAPQSTVIVPRPTRDQSILTTGWWEMVTNLERVPCMGKALGYGGVGGVFTGIVNRFMRQRSAFDGWVLGFMVTSTAIFFNCRYHYERELALTKKLMNSQSRPVSTEEMLAAEKAYEQKLNSTATSSDSTTK